MLANTLDRGAPASARPGATVLRLHGVTKRFPGVLGLDAIDFDLLAGEIHALAGENGAGKSSLIKVLGGIYLADAGSMELDGRPYRPASPQEAIAAGVRVVHQEFNLLPYLSVAENVLFERLPRRACWFVDRAALDQRCRELLSLVGLPDMPPDIAVERLGVAQQQLVEIARALSQNARILVLDEPTATLTPRETERLFEIIHRLKRGGVAVLFISHHLEETFANCDRVTVLRNGRKIATQPVASTTPAALVRMMVGRDIATNRVARDAVSHRAVLELRALRPKGSHGPGVSLTLHAGEILGIAGLVGSGRTELLRAIFGAERAASGTICRDGRPVTIRSPADAIRHGICMVTENRKEEGLLLPLPISTNVTLAGIARYCRLGFVQGRREAADATRYARELDVRMRSIHQAVRNLSGGNQQKVVLAKWLLEQPKILLLDEPTRGIDVGAKAEIHGLLRRLAGEGVGLIVVSSEIAELLALADRVLVISRGVAAGEMAGAAMTEEAILHLAYSEYTKDPAS